MTFEVFGKASTSADPGECAFDDPALGENNETMQLAAFDDLEGPGSRLCHGGGRLGSLIAGVGKDAFEERKAAARRAIEDQSCPVAILNVGRMDDDVQEEAERIDENVALATRDLLARVIARRVERCPPFCAPLALWASMMAAVGLASRPACSRAAR